MPTKVEVHPTAKVAAYAVGGALLVAFVIFGLQRMTRSDAAPANASPPANQFTTESRLTVPRSGPLVPVIDLQITDATQEKNWSAALATHLSGRTEVPVEAGRADVITEDYAIEVDRFEKYHDAIGQALHYGLKTGKIPTVALMISSDSWPLSEKTRAKLLVIDQICTKQGIKLVLLHRTESSKVQE